MKENDSLVHSIFENQFEFKNEVFESFIDDSIDKNYDDNTVSFIECIFKQPFIIRHLKAKEISFIDCTFEKEMFLVKCEIGIIGFINCVFLDILQLTSNICTNYTVLKKIKSDKLVIEGSYNTLQIVSSKIDNIQIKNINNDTSFKGSKIEFLIENEINKLNIEPHNTFSEIIFKESNYNTILFEGSFHGRILFEYNIQCKNLFFESSSFYQRIDFEKGYFENLSFYRSVFNGLIFLSDFGSQDKLFTRYLYIKMLSVHSCTFNKDFSIWLSKIEDISLSNNTFNQLFQFNNYNDSNKANDRIVMLRLDGVNRGTIVIEKAYLDISVSGINFSDIFIKDLSIHTLSLWELDNKGSITLNNVDSGSFLNINDAVIGKLNFVNTNINNFDEIVIANSNIQEINLNQYPEKILSYSSNPIVGYGLKDKSKNTINLKHIYNQLKQVAIKNGNTDVGNRYQSLEYKQLMLSKKFSWDSVLLALNWVSNDNGKNWFRGILFTFSITLVFFSIYIYVLEIPVDKIYFIEDYILFLTSFPKLQLDKFSESNNTWQVSLVIWLSRIFISYGIYQTIAAFRKYGK